MVSARAALRQPLTIVLLVAFALRLAWALLVPVIPQSDAAMYDSFAREILAGHGYVFPGGRETAYWPVGASALYAVAYAIFGTGGLGVAVFNVAMGTAMAGLGYGIARLRFGERAGLIAGLLIACWPTWIAFATVPNSEMPYALLLMLAILLRTPNPVAPAQAGASGGKSATLPHWLLRNILAAACLAGSAYMRPIVMPLFVALPLFDWLRHRDWKRMGLDLIATLLVAAALIGPWAMRNKALFGHPVPISTNFGANLWMGNNPQSNGGYMALPQTGIANEVERDQHFKQTAIAFIKAHPGRYLTLTAHRVPLSLDRESVGIAWNSEALPDGLLTPLKALATIYWLAAFLLSLAGFVLLMRQSLLNLFDPVIVAVGLVFATAILVVGGDRYHLPADPFIAIVAAYLLAHFWPGQKKAAAN